jgi:hypothetical protein
VVSAQAAYWVLVLVTVIYWSLVGGIVSSLFTDSNIGGCKTYSLRKDNIITNNFIQEQGEAHTLFLQHHFNIISHQYSDLPTLSSNDILLTQMYTHVSPFPHDIFFSLT